MGYTRVTTDENGVETVEIIKTLERFKDEKLERLSKACKDEILHTVPLEDQINALIFGEAEADCFEKFLCIQFCREHFKSLKQTILEAQDYDTVDALQWPGHEELQVLWSQYRDDHLAGFNGGNRTQDLKAVCKMQDNQISQIYGILVKQQSSIDALTSMVEKKEEKQPTFWEKFLNFFKPCQSF